MDIVIDSVCVNHLVKPRSDGQPDDITGLVKRKLVRVAVDTQRAIEDEWKVTAGEEAVQVLVTHWADSGGFILVKRDGALAKDLKKQLDQLAFLDQIDRLIVKTALATTDRQIVSDDSDFWDPKDTKQKGQPNAPVIKLLRESEGVAVETLAAFIRSFPVAAHSQEGKAKRNRKGR